MESALKDLGVTFLVGAFAILGLEFILHYLLGRDLTRFFRGQLGLSAGGAGEQANVSDRSSLSATAFVMLAFAVGIMTEDLSYKFMDSGWLPLNLESKAARRVSALVRECPHGGQVPSPLGRDLATSQAFTRFLGNDPATRGIESWFATCTDEAKSACHRLSDEALAAADRLYYYAKNTVYGHDNYYDEMKRIQTRGEFSRSVLIVSFCYACFAGMIVLGLLATGGWRARFTYPSRFTTEATRVLGALVFIMAVAYYAFERESEEFNKRAYGYFSSELIAQQDAMRRGVEAGISDGQLRGVQVR